MLACSRCAMIVTDMLTPDQHEDAEPLRRSAGDGVGTLGRRRSGPRDPGPDRRVPAVDRERDLVVGDRVVICSTIGCGPVGMFAVSCAQLPGAGRVLAVDQHPAAVT